MTGNRLAWKKLPCEGERPIDYNTNKGLILLVEDLIQSTILLEVQTNSEGKNEKEARSSFYLGFLFHYPNLKELIRKGDKGDNVFHPHLENAISSITYSTSRGILMTRFQGTPFESFILPVIDPNSLLRS